MTKKAKKKTATREPLRFPDTAAPMTGEALRIALQKLDINQSAFARLIGVQGRAVRSWIADEFPVPMAVGYLVNLMIKTKTKPEELK